MKASELNNSSGRTVTISHTRPPTGRGQVHYCYGDAITGRPIIEAHVMDAPRTQDDLEWLRDYLPSYIGPGGVISLHYKAGGDGWEEPTVVTVQPGTVEDGTINP